MIFRFDRSLLNDMSRAAHRAVLIYCRALLSAERMELIRSWRHSGFNVYVGEAIGPEERQTIGHIARYLLRAPVSLERLWYNPEAGTVTIRPLAGEGDSPVELGVLEFIARLIMLQGRGETPHCGDWCFRGASPGCWGVLKEPYPGGLAGIQAKW